MVLSTIQTVSLVIGIIYYITIMRNQQKTQELARKAQEEAENSRKRQLILQRFQSYNLDYYRAYHKTMTAEFNDLEEYRRKYDRTVNIEHSSMWNYIVNTFNIAGLLYQEENTDLDLLFHLYPPNSIIRLWEQYSPVIIDLRHRMANPDLYKPFENLYAVTKEKYPDTPPIRQV
jgi:hypothetical protein